MADVYNKKINRNTDWGGDRSTSGLPVAGNRVQEFIKDEFSQKAGAFLKPSGGNFVFCFATKEDRDLYEETGNESLIIDRFETETIYNLSFREGSFERRKSILEGSTGNTINFDFTIVNKEGYVSDPKATVVFTFESEGVVKKYTKEVFVSADGWTNVDSGVIDDYLRNGINNITISVTGISTKTQGQITLTYSVFDLSYRTSFKYNEVQNTNAVSLEYYIKCTETKYVEFYLDGVEVESSDEQVIYDGVKEGTFNISIINLTSGQHTLQTRAYVKASDGSKFYSDTYYYVFAKQGSLTPTFLMEKKFNNTQPLQQEGENLNVLISQFEEFSFDWSLYDSLSRKFTVNFEFDGELLSKTIFNINETINEFSFRPLSYGDDKVLRIYAVNDSQEILFEHIINFDIKGSDMGVKETVDGLLLKLSAVGRRNTDEDKDVWTCVGTDMNMYRADFHNFEWTTQQGWNEETESLVISDGAYVDFNIRPMINDWKNNGGTFEIELETFDIEDENSIICECMTHIEGINTAYFKITATSAEFGTKQGKKISTQYKDNEKLKIAFIGNRTGTTSEDGNLIYIMVNGVLERASLYEDTDNIQSDSYLRIGAIDGGCKVRLRSIRVYNRGIRVDEEFNNFVVDSDNSQIIYERNNIFKENTNEVGFDEIANKIPVMIFTGDMLDLVNNGQDKKWRFFDVEYVNRQEPSRNFVSFNCQMKLQGTSSLGYPRKNFKLKTKDKLVTEDFYQNSNYILDTEETTVGNQRLRNKITGELLDVEDTINNCYTFDYRGKILKKGKYKFRGSSHKADKWTLKADYMESSCSHNVAAGRSWNDIFENTILDIDPYLGYVNNTYKDSALITSDAYRQYSKDGVTYRINNNADSMKSQKKYVCRTEAQKICHAEGADDIRTAVDGFPMVCFYRRNHRENELVFMGQYNFINDKASYEVFGFEDIEDPNDENEDKVMIYDATQVECWEGLTNSNPIALFKTIDGWDSDSGWKDTFESRYPELKDDDNSSGKRQPDASVGSPLYEFCKWVTSTRHEEDTEYNGTITIDARFAKRINSYQYAYVLGDESNYYYLPDNEDELVVEDNAANRKLKFAVEKWEHFDVWKLAGYYIYLMRYGAVDQFVKNTMLFTDGNGKYDSRTDNKYRKWFYLNYDNDCLFGLRNNGQLAFGWDLDRQTLDNVSDNSKRYVVYDADNNLIGKYFTQIEAESVLADYEGGRIEVVDAESSTVNTYAMMGHDSTLWNNLEEDEEFMRMVRDLDDSMSNYGLNYNNMVNEFDTKQTERWCERIYNSNERYKYIQAAKGTGDMQGNPVDNLWMLQGTRRSHRHWWIANHFNMLDARWLSGEYKKTYIKIRTDSPAGSRITAVAGADYYYAWGQQKRIYESNIIKSEGETIDFIFDKDQKQGDPVYIYAYNKMSEIDFSEVADKVATDSFEFNDGGLDVYNTLKKLVIGNPNFINGAEITTTTWGKLNKLEYLDITNFIKITSLPFKVDIEKDGVIEHLSLPNLHVLKARGSGLGSFTPVEGSRFDLVELPTTITSIILNNVQFSDLASQFNYTPNIQLGYLEIRKTNGIDEPYFTKIIRPWLIAINNSQSSEVLYSNAKLILDNVDWKLTSFDDILLFENISKVNGAFVISGVIDLSALNSISMENIEKIKSIFGENCFNSNESSIYIKVPETVFIHSDSEYGVAGKENIFRREIYPAENALPIAHDIEYFLVKETGKTETSIFDPITNKYYDILTDSEISEIRGGTVSLINARDENNREIAILQSQEIIFGNRDTDLKVMCMLTMGGGFGSVHKVSVCDYKIKNPTYAVNASIEYFSGTTSNSNNGKSFYKNNEYIFKAKLTDYLGNEPIGTENVDWTITMDNMSDIDYYLLSYDKIDESGIKFKIVTSDKEPDENLISARITLSIEVTNYNGGNHLTANYTALIINGNVIMTSESNPSVMSRCHLAWPSIVTNPNALTKQQAEQITDIGTEFSGIREDFTFDEFEYFKGLTSIANGAFDGCIKMSKITLPSTITSIGEGAFANCKKLQNIKSINGEYSLPNIETINERTFVGCQSLNKLRLPDSLRLIKNYAFGGTGFRKVMLHNDEFVEGVLLLPNAENEWRIEGNAFETSIWTSNSDANKLTVFSVQKKLNLTNNEKVLYGRYYTEYRTEQGCQSYISENGILYSTSNGVDKYSLIKYPALKNTVEVETINLDGLQAIDAYAFLYCVNLNKVVVPVTVKAYFLGSNCFEKSSVKIVDFSNCTSLCGIPSYCFFECPRLTDVMLPNSILEIGRNAFYRCPSLTGMTLNNGITTFDHITNTDSTFYDCGFTSIEIPDTVETSYPNLISNCPNLTSVKFSKLMPTDVRGVVINCPNLTTVHLPCFSYYDSITYNVYDENNELIGNGYTTIAMAESVMPEGGHIETVYGNNIIVNEAFDGFFINECPNLVEFIEHTDENELLFNVTDNVIYSGNKLIRVPFGKETVQYKEGVTEIAQYAFSKCNRITNIDDAIKDIETFGDFTFQFSSLTSITINDKITKIPRYCVSGCKQLVELYSGKNVDSIGYYAFGGCEKLSKMYFFSEEAPKLAKLDVYHPFGSSISGSESKYAGYDTRTLGNIIRKPYGSTGYDFDGDLQSESWVHPVTDSDKCGYEFDYIIITGSPENGLIRINIESDAEFVYVKSEYGGLHDGGFDCSTAQRQADGRYQFTIGNNIVYHGEKITVYSDFDCQNEIGYFYANFFENEYDIITENLGSRSILKSGNEEDDTVKITKSEYDLIISNLRYLNKIINKM